MVCETSRVKKPELAAHPREERGIRFTSRSVQISPINIQTETPQMVGDYEYNNAEHEYNNAERRRTSTYMHNMLKKSGQASSTFTQDTSQLR